MLRSSIIKLFHVGILRLAFTWLELTWGYIVLHTVWIRLIEIRINSDRWHFFTYSYLAFFVFFWYFHTRRSWLVWFAYDLFLQLLLCITNRYRFFEVWYLYCLLWHFFNEIIHISGSFIIFDFASCDFFSQFYLHLECSAENFHVDDILIMYDEARSLWTE